MQRVPSEKWDSDRTLASQAFATPALAISGLCGKAQPIQDRRCQAVAQRAARITAAADRHRRRARHITVAGSAGRRANWSMFRAMLENAVRTCETNCGICNCAKTVAFIISVSA